MEDVRAYIDGVTSGEIPSCQWVKLAVKRHVEDIETGKQRGIWFSDDHAQYAIDFFRFLKHSKGEWAGRPLHLEPWQKFIVASLFGWLRKNDDGQTVRRFRTAYIEVPRKNGKTTLAAGIGLYLLVSDNEPGAEVYSAATMRDQARISHKAAINMVKASPELRKRVKIYRDNLRVDATDSKFEPVGRDADGLDGLNVSGAIIDELHAHKTREMYDIMETATGSRRQPLILNITTAGFNRQSVCYETHTLVEGVLKGSMEDDSLFGIIYGIDEGDAWDDPATWRKANPNYGISVKIEQFTTLISRAKFIVSALNSFLCKHLDVWTQSESAWINFEKWDACGAAVDADGLQGRKCYAGLDLSSTTDVTALVLAFPPEVEGDPYQFLCRFWIPEEAVVERSRRDQVPYDAWVRQGLVYSTPGSVIDYSYVLAQLDQDAQRYDIKEIAYDRWGATKLRVDMEEQGHEIVQFGQGFASMSPPTKEFERLILCGEVAHGGNPVLSWMAGNVVVSEDAAGNIKPNKAKSREKIDGIVALIMSLARATLETDDESVYEKGDLRVL